MIIKKANHFSAKPARQPTHHSEPHFGTILDLAVSNLPVHFVPLRG